MIKRLAGLLLLLSCGISLYLETRATALEVQQLPERLQRVAAVPRQERVWRQLSFKGRVPLLPEVQALVAPVLKGAPPFSITWAYVAPGMGPRPPALRGATVLTALLSPRSFVVGPPLELLHSWLQQPSPGSELAWVARAPFIVFAGMSPKQVTLVRGEARRLFHQEVLVAGFSNGRDLHVALRFDVARGLRQGQPAFERYRPLFVP